MRNFNSQTSKIDIMHELIDLRSDTVTKPTPAMLEVMMNANVGDDVLGDDPEVIALEAMMAAMFGKEASVFCPSGTMTNQIAIKVHTRPGDEVICDITSHIYNFEGGGIGFNSGCSVKLVNGSMGRMKPEQVLASLNPPENVHYAFTRLVVAENTSNKGGGSIYNYDDLAAISEICKQKNLKFHLDGARLFNALVETGQLPGDFGKLFDSISICFSKGLGAPVGSVLIGDKEFITSARRVKKVFGGGMRQAGYLAAAASFAIKNNIPRLKEDNNRAKQLGHFLSSLKYVDQVLPVDSNIVIFSIENKRNVEEFLDLLKEKRLIAFGFGLHTIRFVTHMGFDDPKLERACEILRQVS
jgi:threonine aldolase